MIAAFIKSLSVLGAIFYVYWPHHDHRIPYQI